MSEPKASFGIEPFEGSFRFLAQSDVTEEKYLVDIEEYKFSGACNCMHFLTRLAPRIAQGERGATVRCKHLRRAREFFLEDVLPKLAKAMGREEPDLGLEVTISAQATQYAKERVKFLAKHPQCAVFPNLKATQCHHSKGRLGSLLMDQRWWIPVSMAGHQFVDANRNKAREMTWNGIPILCARGQWNVAPTQHNT